MVRHLQVMKLRPQYGVGLVALAAILWGTGGIAVKATYTLYATSPLSIIVARLAIASLLLNLFRLFVRSEHTAPPSRRHLGMMIALGVVFVLAQICYYVAITLVGVTLATLITFCLQPLLVAALSALWGTERLSGKTRLSLVGGLLGTGLLLAEPMTLNAVSWRLVLGVALACGAGLFYALVTLFSRALATRYHPLQALTTSLTSGLICVLPVALVTGIDGSSSPVQWGLLAYTGVVYTVAAYLLFFAGIRHISAVVGGIIALLEPVTAVAMAALLFGEYLGPVALLGALVLLGTLVLLNISVCRGGKPPRSSES